MVQEESSLDREVPLKAFCTFATNILQNGYKQCVFRCVDIVSNKTRNSSGNEMSKRDDMQRYARFACLTTPCLTLSGGDLGDFSDFWWVSCRVARLQYGAKYPRKVKPLSRVHARHRRQTDRQTDLPCHTTKRNVVTFG